MSAKIGDTLLKLLSGAQSEVTIIAPFMKAGVISRLVAGHR